MVCLRDDPDRENLVIVVPLVADAEEEWYCLSITTLGVTDLDSVSSFPEVHTRFQLFSHEFIKFRVHAAGVNVVFV